MEVPSDTQVVSQIKPEELSEIEKNNIDFGSFSIQENELDKLSQHDGSVPSSIASQIDCKMFLQFGDLLKGFFLKLPLQRLTENLIYEQPEDPLYFLLWQIQDIIKERNQS
ncbi:testis-specific expressed protein 55 isoform X3 [Notamacropus eugenii]|uniref:testis-specific expressed protein 55 isoform X3 n=1 Tax=Notamacropus eugenii TaxID=9315 RepID=UPI003B6849FD